FCGSGTFPIEAAMMAANIAPGMTRDFTAKAWTGLIDPREWALCVEEANDIIDRNISTDIQGYDIDDEMVKISRANARAAGVEDLIHFQRKDVREMSHAKKYGFVITNPPYGERLEDRESVEGIYKTLGERFKTLDSWSLYVITSYEDAEKAMGLKASKNRKIYNGMMKTYFYQIPGPKPPGKNEKNTL
nr:methyltransferase [Lachnospiraceae bacterium]